MFLAKVCDALLLKKADDLVNKHNVEPRNGSVTHRPRHTSPQRVLESLFRELFNIRQVWRVEALNLDLSQHREKSIKQQHPIFLPASTFYRLRHSFWGGGGRIFSEWIECPALSTEGDQSDGSLPVTYVNKARRRADSDKNTENREAVGGLCIFSMSVRRVFLPFCFCFSTIVVYDFIAASDTCCKHTFATVIKFRIHIAWEARLFVIYFVILFCTEHSSLHLLVVIITVRDSSSRRMDPASLKLDLETPWFSSTENI